MCRYIYAYKCLMCCDWDSRSIYELWKVCLCCMLWHVLQKEEISWSALYHQQYFWGQESYNNYDCRRVQTSLIHLPTSPSLLVRVRLKVYIDLGEIQIISIGELTRWDILSAMQSSWGTSLRHRPLDTRLTQECENDGLKIHTYPEAS